MVLVVSQAGKLAAQQRVERFDGRQPSLLDKAAGECARTIGSAARISARSD